MSLAVVRAARVPGVLAMGLVAGLSYPWTFANHFPAHEAIAWKGLGVGLLAVWAAVNAETRDGRMLAAVLGLWAAADVVLELRFEAGAALFAAGHVVAMGMFWRNRDLATPAASIRWGALLALTIGLGVASARLPDPLRWQAGAYALLLILMAALANRSRFRLAGSGALLFAASDWLLLVRQGGQIGEPAAWIGLAIWYLYFAGVLLIALGTRAGLDRAAETH